MAINTIAGERDVRNHRGFPIVFVPQAALPSATAYEAFIGETGSVPTRENLHDFFNALVWYHFPLTKNILYEKFLTLRRNRLDHGRRSKPEDWLTLLDEGGEIVDSQKNGVIFGHAILENFILSPDRNINSLKINLNDPTVDQDLIESLKVDLSKIDF